MGRNSDHKHSKGRGKSSHQRQQFLQATLREMSGGCFGKYYLRHLTHINTENTHRELTFGFKVVPSLCTRAITASSGEGSGVGSTENDLIMSTSAVLALFDDLSTVSLVAKDRTFRPGVSVQLSAEVLQSISVNNEVLIRTRADKIGKMLGFSSIEMWSAAIPPEAPVLLARGRHIKFLPMGWLWDTFLGFGFFVTLFLWLYDKFRGKDLVTEIDHVISNIVSGDDTTANKRNGNEKKFTSNSKSSKTDNVEINALQSAALVKSFNIEMVKEDIPALYPELLNDVDASICHFYQVKVKPFMYNAVSSFHGGAVALSIEEACVLAKEKALKGCSIPHRVKVANMDVRYLSAMKVSSRACDYVGLIIS